MLREIADKILPAKVLHGVASRTIVSEFLKEEKRSETEKRGHLCPFFRFRRSIDVHKSQALLARAVGPADGVTGCVVLLAGTATTMPDRSIPVARAAIIQGVQGGKGFLTLHLCWV